jgi:hypothetical protein
MANRDELGVLEHLTQSDPVEIQIANRAIVRDPLGQTPKLSGAESREVVQGATYTVNSTDVVGDSYLEDGICDTANNPTIGDGIPHSGICTIVAAVQQANFTVDANNRHFSIPGTSAPTIPLSGDLIIDKGPVTIDGATHGYSSGPCVEITGSRCAVGFKLTIKTGNSIVRGMIFNGRGFACVSLTDLGSNVIEGD